MSPQYDWRQLADLHRPTDPALIAAEVRRLHRTGLTPRDVATALRIDLSTVHLALQPENP